MPHFDGLNQIQVLIFLDIFRSPVPVKVQFSPIVTCALAGLVGCMWVSALTANPSRVKSEMSWWRLNTIPWVKVALRSGGRRAGVCQSIPNMVIAEEDMSYPPFFSQSVHSPCTLGPAIRIPYYKNMGRDLALDKLRICPCYVCCGLYSTVSAVATPSGTLWWHLQHRARRRLDRLQQDPCTILIAPILRGAQHRLHLIFTSSSSIS